MRHRGLERRGVHCTTDSYVPETTGDPARLPQGKRREPDGSRLDGALEREGDFSVPLLPDRLEGGQKEERDAITATAECCTDRTLGHP